MQNQTLDSLYSVRDIARIFGLTESRVRYWAQTGFINPTGTQGGKRLYNFRDLVGIKAAKELLESGIPLQRVRRNLQALREALPRLEQPLTKMRVFSDGEHMVVGHREGDFDPLSGQMLLDFQIEELSLSVAQILDMNVEVAPAATISPIESETAKSETAKLETTKSETPKSEKETLATEIEQTAAAGMALGSDQIPLEPETAYGWFMRGCACDNDEERTEEAIAAYEQAIELDPSLAAAHTNLGNIYYQRRERDKALHYYQTACALDPDQAEARYNLANFCEEDGEFDMAIAEYRRALASSPNFADAHFNLALTLERVGSKVQAIDHWRRYLELTAEGQAELQEWRQMARQHLELLEKAAVAATAPRLSLVEDKKSSTANPIERNLVENRPELDIDID